MCIVFLTSLARLNDITAMGKRWQIRRLGLILTGASSVVLVVAPIIDETYAWPTWRFVALSWGFALTWLTTPGMPPWHKYISGEYKQKKGQQA